MSARRVAPVTLFISIFCVLTACLVAGCGSKNRTPPAATKPLSVTIAPGNDAPARGRTLPDDEPTLRQRAFAFEMAGFSAPIHDAAQEQRTAAMQAAVISAFCQALIEARRARGQSYADFTAEIGPRLTVRHCRTDDGSQAEINVISRGVETSFVVRNGRLQHPPRDVRLVQRIFDETNGEFSLLGTEWQPDADSYVAKVGCYLPAGSPNGLTGALAGDAQGDPADAPPAP